MGVYRTGRKCLNHIYLQAGPEPDHDNDIEVAVALGAPDVANEMGPRIVEALNFVERFKRQHCTCDGAWWGGDHVGTCPVAQAGIGRR
jgi:hypothetical protein